MSRRAQVQPGPWRGRWELPWGNALVGKVHVTCTPRRSCVLVRGFLWEERPPGLFEVRLVRRACFGQCNMSRRDRRHSQVEVSGAPEVFAILFSLPLGWRRHEASNPRSWDIPISRRGNGGSER